MKNACVIGYGAIGPIHASALKKSEYANLYAICDNDPTRLKKAEEENDCKLFSDFDDVLSDENVDVIHICTPHYLHKEMAIKAFEAGKDVVLEKPCAISREEFDELCSYKTDRKICVMLQNRINDSVLKIKDIIDNDKSVGKMKGVCAFVTWERTPEYYASDEWRGKWSTEGGGLLINQAIHTLDLVNYFMGEVKSVKASISTKKLNDCIEVEDTADCFIEGANGVDALFYASNAFCVSAPVRVEITFENATIRYADEKVYYITQDDVKILDFDEEVPEGKRYWGGGHKFEIDAFYKNLCGEDSTYVTLDDAVPVMKLLFAIYESAKNDGKKIFIK